MEAEWKDDEPSRGRSRGPTPTEKLRIIAWALWPRDGGPEDLGSYAAVMTFRALVLGFDPQERLERFELIER